MDGAPDPDRVEEALGVSAEADTSGGRDSMHDYSDAFAGLYDEAFDELREAADRRGVSVSDAESAYEAVVEGRRHLTSHDDLMGRSGLGYHRARQAAAVISDAGDLHEAYDDDWDLWWVRCDERIREMCESRRISLYRYYEMYDDLRQFQDKVIGWYVRRNRRQQQPFQLTDLKAEWVDRLQTEYFPDKPLHEPVDSEGDADGPTFRHPERGLVEEGEWSRHIAARYVRTAQDEIIEAYDLSY